MAGHEGLREFLPSLFHHRWSAAVLVAIVRAEGARFVELQSALEVSAVPLRASLDALASLGLVTRNPGYGHPLRPEYIATARGGAVGIATQRLLVLLQGLDVEEIALRKWSLPVLAVIAAGESRYGAIQGALAGVTPRALAISLKDLVEARLIGREVQEGYPPVPVYRATRAGKRVARVLTAITKAAGIR